MCCVAMFSCNNEDILSENTSTVNNQQTIEQSFNVTENDIYNIVSDFINQMPQEHLAAIVKSLRLTQLRTKQQGITLIPICLRIWSILYN